MQEAVGRNTEKIFRSPCLSYFRCVVTGVFSSDIRQPGPGLSQIFSLLALLHAIFFNAVSFFDACHSDARTYYILYLYRQEQIMQMLLGKRAWL